MLSNVMYAATRVVYLLKLTYGDGRKVGGVLQAQYQWYDVR